MIEVIFSSSTHETSAFGLTQWDKGQKLKIIWGDAPNKFQVHFSSRGSDEAVVVDTESKDGVAVADIPDELLKVGADIFAWIYISENDDEGESVKKAVLYVRPRAKPQNVLDTIEPSQQEKLEGILKDIKDSIGYMKENGVDAEYLPEYVTKTADDLAQKINNLRDENSIVFMLASDAHYKTGDYNNKNSIRHMSQAMKIIAEKCPINFAAYLGDMTEGGADKSIEEAKDEIMNVNSLLHPVFSYVPSLRCHGSEDNLHKAVYRNGDYIDSKELYSYVGSWNKDAVRPDSNAFKGYCYMDLEFEKLRVICLNTSDTYGTELSPAAETAVIGSEQLAWFCRALDLSAKSDCTDWGIVIIGHHPINMVNKFPLTEYVIDRFLKGKDINVVMSDSAQIIYTFSGKKTAKLLGQFHGHLHNYRVNFITDKKIPIVAIPNASLDDNNFYADPSYTNDENADYAEEKTFNKKPNSATDTAFCVIVLNKKTGLINALHYGAGKDRIIADGTVSEDFIQGDDENEDNGGSGDSGENGGNTGGESGGNTGGETGGEVGGDNGGEEGGDEDDSGNTYVYTNLVPGSKSAANGSYSDGFGYFDDYFLTSANGLYYGEGYTHTGYMQIAYNDIIRIAGGTYDGTIGNYIFVFDDNHNMIYVKPLGGYTDVNAGISFTDSGILVFEPSKVTETDLSAAAYLRVSTKCLGENLIVTANEPVDGSSVMVIAPPIISYTNIMRFAMTESGSAYGTGGYRNGRILNKNSVEADKKNFTVTGYIEVEANAVVRFKGLILDGSEGCCMCVYDSAHQLICNIPLNVTSAPSYGITYANEMYTFTPANATVDLSNMVYFRLSGKGNGSTVIITYNEEIT